jgi:hypothetical protein
LDKCQDEIPAGLVAQNLIKRIKIVKTCARRSGRIVFNWLNRMGEPLYGKQTPDGYPLIETAWASPEQMNTCFEIAKAIGSGSAGLFKIEGPQLQERPAFSQLANELYYQSLQKKLSETTRQALEQAGSPQEWTMFYLASPEMMNR